MSIAEWDVFARTGRKEEAHLDASEGPGGPFHWTLRKGEWADLRDRMSLAAARPPLLLAVLALTDTVIQSSRPIHPASKGDREAESLQESPFADLIQPVGDDYFVMMEVSCPLLKSLGFRSLPRG